MELDYKIRRSTKRSTITITVERDCDIVVHAPFDMSDDKIKAIVDDKRQWIYEKLNHPQKIKNRPHPPGKELVSGESLLYLGNEYMVEKDNNVNNEVVFNNKFTFPIGVKSKEEAAKLMKVWYIGKAEEIINPKVKQYAKVLGVSVSKIKISDNKYQWGSCSIKNAISINWKIIKAPMFVVDYVIIHELTHLIVGNHTPDFWNIVSVHTASLDKAKQWLKLNGQILEGEL